MFCCSSEESNGELLQGKMLKLSVVFHYDSAISTFHIKFTHYSVKVLTNQLSAILKLSCKLKRTVSSSYFNDTFT
jgi:hypothetical protein